MSDTDNETVATYRVRSDIGLGVTRHRRTTWVRAKNQQQATDAVERLLDNHSVRTVCECQPGRYELLYDAEEVLQN